LERLRFASLGYSFHSCWCREVLWGCVIGALMILLVVLLQVIGGGTQVSFNPTWSLNIAYALKNLCLASLLLVVAAAFEEIVFRGYVFQTLLRDVPAWLPIILLSLFFGLAHWSNPSRTTFSIINTVLAGVWLAVAYLKTHSLWFPTALHFSWNWTMGLFFGLPVSGLPLGPSVLTATSEAPLWLTGGSYGSEGGVAATVVFALATILIWRVKWLCVASEIELAWPRNEIAPETTLKLGLNQNPD
ncbi:MAG TPA: CPBP family intramembrane glutamic endopeptidase, partial [Blastocatellia bacterium]|nr:CPBP family intramembrane glutamic endopeptidase [Blastocatellia bacterium]